MKEDDRTRRVFVCKNKRCAATPCRIEVLREFKVPRHLPCVVHPGYETPEWEERGLKPLEMECNTPDHAVGTRICHEGVVYEAVKGIACGECDIQNICPGPIRYRVFGFCWERYRKDKQHIGWKIVENTGSNIITTGKPKDKK